MNPFSFLRFFSLFAVTITLLVPRGQADETVLTLRACLAVEDYSAGSSEFPKIEVFDQDSVPGPGKHLSLYAESDADGVVVLAAFDVQTGGLVEGWRPHMEVVAAGEEHRLPVAPTVWQWEQATDAFEVVVLFLEQHISESKNLETLIDAMQNPSAKENTLSLQSKKLRSEVDSLMVLEDAAELGAGTLPSQWAGTLRGASFPWRSLAKKIPIEGARAFLIYRYEP